MTEQEVRLEAVLTEQEARLEAIYEELRDTLSTLISDYGKDVVREILDELTKKEGAHED